MSAILDHYITLAQSQPTASSLLQAWQAEALSELKSRGFPARRDEAWKYTTLDALLQQPFHLQTSPVALDPVMSGVECPDQAISLRLQDGEYMPSAAPHSWPAGVVVQSLAQACQQHPEKIKAYLQQVLPSSHGLQALNTAMLSQGLFIYIPEGVSCALPLWLSHCQTQSGQITSLRHLIVAEASSDVTLVEDYTSTLDEAYFTNTITEIVVGAHAKVRHYKCQREGKKAYHYSHLAVHQKAHSEFESHVLQLGGQWVRSDLNVVFQAPHARCLLNGVYAPQDEQHIDQHTVVNHAVPHCYSEQDYKGLLQGRAQAVFDGQVVVVQDAQRSEAHQQNKNLLLSQQAQINTKPQLNIYADDVVCTHGATVGQLDEEALFYLATRGLSREKASRFLIQAFFAENVAKMTHSMIKDWMQQRLNQHLG